METPKPEVGQVWLAICEDDNGREHVRAVTIDEIDGSIGLYGTQLLDGELMYGLRSDLLMRLPDELRSLRASLSRK